MPRQKIFVVPLGPGLREKPAVMLTVFLVLVALLAVSVYLFITDYITSVYGYNQLQTQKVSDLEAWFVGALPQLVQVAFWFMALERRNWIFGGIAALAMFVDIGTDMTFRVGQATSLAVYITAFLQSIILFTLGSEFLLIASAENIIEYMPDVLESMATASTRLADSFTKAASTISDDEEPASPPVAHSKRSRRPGP
jgi:hypothetical protein